MSGWPHSNSQATTSHAAIRDNQMAGASATMIQLNLAGLSRDGARMLLVSDDGSQFSLDVDDELRAALRGDHARIGQLEIQMESALRPRDIQARIRAGESPETVAKAAQTSVEQIMPYAAPVLAERAHVADRAQRASLRPSPGARRTADPSGPPGGRTLADGVASHLRPQHVDPETVEWDAWRREDGRWMLTATYSVGDEAGVARFAFDAPGNYVTTENDEARWLVGEPTSVDDVAAIHEPPDAIVADDLDLARRRRSRDSTEAEAPEDADDAAAEAHAEESTVDLSETAERIRSAEFEPPRREVTKTRGRASVPSWDEIMFGKGE